MFLPVNHSKFATPMPRDCSFRESDWRALAGFWHPVAFAHEIADRPVAARLLDVPLVIWRTSAGISVARDLCPHRGTRLSAGHLAGDDLICPMHGLVFDGSGRCTRNPSMPDQSAAIPAKMRLFLLRSDVRYGIVWACLAEDPVWPLPVWPGIGDDRLKKSSCPRAPGRRPPAGTSRTSTTSRISPGSMPAPSAGMRWRRCRSTGCRRPSTA